MQGDIMKKEEISKFLKELRLNKNISQERLANDLHVDRSLVSKWERGICLPDITMLKELSDYYNLDISEIIKGKKSINKKYIIIPVCLVIIILLIIVFKNAYLGYKIINIDYNYDSNNQKIKLGIPKCLL
jgi:transcriptional regulator with XRE-family HTH domain